MEKLKIALKSFSCKIQKSYIEIQTVMQDLLYNMFVFWGK